MSQVTLNFSRCAGFLPGTTGWLKEQLEKRKATLKVSQIKNGRPACFLEYKEGETRKTQALAIFGYWGTGDYSTETAIDTWPFDSDIGETFFGACLTPAATQIILDLAEEAKALLKAEMDKDDNTETFAS